MKFFIFSCLTAIVMSAAASSAQNSAAEDATAVTQTCEEIAAEAGENGKALNFGNLLISLETFAEQGCSPQHIVDLIPADTSRHELCSDIMIEAQDMTQAKAADEIEDELFEELALIFQAMSKALQCSVVFLE
ncbi:MAG: hypothetical protein OSB62_06960 [Alphaproteobacteria bacterium]|nr:hypothetical protein [Alphaproteobacteria bacterium]